MYLAGAYGAMWYGMLTAFPRLVADGSEKMV
jgi:hypothetical protein